MFEREHIRILYYKIFSVATIRPYIANNDDAICTKSIVYQDSSTNLISNICNTTDVRAINAHQNVLDVSSDLKFIII